ncbi:pyridoxamine 5'-phosphate oxidase family protein [Candidatus Kaiserbacteria bacterium]|nr:pyridoxamine 5'-phosphate oxidase family protein [Candidatus Kaiserbacteria bacterium]
MLYAVDDNFNIYFGTRKSFGKYNAILADEHVSLAVVEEELDPLRVVDIQGSAEIIPEEQTQELLQWFIEKNTSKYYVKDAEDFVMFKIKPDGVRWLDATSGDLEIHDIECKG